jgi:hypothetical protein
VKLTIQGTPAEIAAFLEPLAGAHFAHEVPPPSRQNADEPKPPGPAQTIAPQAIEQLQFGREQAGTPVDFAQVNATIGDLMRSESAQRAAASAMPALDAFESPMHHVRRYVMSFCVRGNRFDLDALDRLHREFVEKDRFAQVLETAALDEIAQNNQSPGRVNVTFEGAPVQ